MNAVRRQPPPDDWIEWSDPPPGFRIVWVEQDDARPVDGGKCRRPGCLRPAVWELLRSSTKGRHWWRYCDWHTYGRRIEGGRVLSRKLEEVAR